MVDDGSGNPYREDPYGANERRLNARRLRRLADGGGGADEAFEGVVEDVVEGGAGSGKPKAIRAAVKPVERGDLPGVCRRRWRAHRGEQADNGQADGHSDERTLLLSRL